MPRKRSKKLKRIGHYNKKQEILLVGEGDFSFSACLADAFGSDASIMVATSLDSKRSLLRKHSTSEEHLELLESKGCLVLHGVDVHTMARHPTLRHLKFDVIVFNFPHAGFFPPSREWETRVIKRHQNLVEAFLANAGEMIYDDGEVHVTHRDDHPYSEWNLEELGHRSGLVLKEKVEFWRGDYPGYVNKRGSGSKSNKTFPLKDCFTFKFVKPGACTSHRQTCQLL